jgi:hypothetical protein
VRLGAKLFRTKTSLDFASEAPEIVFPKTLFRIEFFFETEPHLLSGPNEPCGTIGGKIVPKRSVVSPKKHVFSPNFFTKPPLQLFSGLNRLYGTFGGKIVLDENFARFCLESPQNRFSQKPVFSLNFFTKPHLTYCWGQTNHMA